MKRRTWLFVARRPGCGARRARWQRPRPACARPAKPDVVLMSKVVAPEQVAALERALVRA
ncbi:MAG: hypothetical protein ACT4P4_04280 [Betaproteobacteria bacterium]